MEKDERKEKGAGSKKQDARSSPSSLFHLSDVVSLVVSKVRASTPGVPRILTP